MGNEYLAADPKPEPEAAIVVARVCSLEAPEDAGLRLLGDADAVVAHFDAGVLVLPRDAHSDRRAGAVFHGVREDVAHHLLDARSVPKAEVGLPDVELERAPRGVEGRLHA